MKKRLSPLLSETKRKFSSPKLKKERNHWIDASNQRIFLIEFAKKHDIQQPSDWGKFSTQDLKEEGGSGVLKRHKNSLVRTLQEVFTETKWESFWFEHLPSSFWQTTENRRIFFNSLEREFNVKKPSDWGLISRNELMKRAGGLINNYFDGSVHKCLKSVFPDIEWRDEWFSKHKYWTSRENQRKFLVQIGKELGVVSPRDWGKISAHQVSERGGAYLLSHYYGNSLFKGLRTLFPEVLWQVEWFPRTPKLPKVYWDHVENRRDFLLQLSEQYGLKEPRDWQRVSVALIRNKGGKSLLRKYRNSLQLVLQSVYPNEKWQPTHEHSLTNPQSGLFSSLKKWIPLSTSI